MHLLLQHFWIAFIVVGVINTLVVARKLRNRPEDHPEEAHERSRILMGFGLLMIAPWIWMGCGVLFGEADGVLSYFQPLHYGFWVRGFFVIIAIVYLLAVYWIFFGTGATTLARYPEVINVEAITRFGISGQHGIKIITAIALIAGSAAMIAMWTVDFLPPPSR